MITLLAKYHRPITVSFIHIIYTRVNYYRNNIFTFRTFLMSFIWLRLNFSIEQFLLQFDANGSPF